MRVLQDKPYHLCFETLANDLRVRIMDGLSRKPMTVGEIARLVNAERSTVSHSLQVLRDCSYVYSQKQGKEMTYFLAPRVLEDLNSTQVQGSGLFRFMDAHIEKFCNNECKKIKN